MGDPTVKMSLATPGQALAWNLATAAIRGAAAELRERRIRPTPAQFQEIARALTREALAAGMALEAAEEFAATLEPEALVAGAELSGREMALSVCNLKAREALQ